MLDCHCITPAERIEAAKKAKLHGWRKPEAAQGEKKKKRKNKNKGTVFFQMYEDERAKYRLSAEERERPTWCERDAMNKVSGAFASVAQLKCCCSIHCLDRLMRCAVVDKSRGCFPHMCK